MVCYFINLCLLTKQHFPPLWWMCVGVYWVLLLPSKSWAYWGNPAALSQSHASFASISEIQESVRFKNGDKKWNLTTWNYSNFGKKHCSINESSKKPLHLVFYRHNRLCSRKTWVILKLKPPVSVWLSCDSMDVVINLLVSLSGCRDPSSLTWSNMGPYIIICCLFNSKTTYHATTNQKCFLKKVKNNSPICGIELEIDCVTTCLNRSNTFQDNNKIKRKYKTIYLVETDLNKRKQIHWFSDKHLTPAVRITNWSCKPTEWAVCRL